LAPREIIPSLSLTPRRRSRDNAGVYAVTRTAAHHGVDSYLVQVEASIASGLPAFVIVGLPDAAVREGAERVRAAVRDALDTFPVSRCSVNLSPASRRKAGSGFDLAIAMAVAAADAKCPAAPLRSAVFLAELGLDGTLRPVGGALPAAIAAARGGARRLVVARENAAEAALADGVSVYGASTFVEVLELVRSNFAAIPVRTDAAALLAAAAENDDVDLCEGRGLGQAKRALEIAAAGDHAVLFSGPPGAGKTMLARRLVTLLPPLDLREAIETTSVYSVARAKGDAVLVVKRPWRAPHHTTSGAGLVGGGSWPLPGEISLAHNGVLFLDELPEFSPRILNQLREPMEDKKLTISRAGAKIDFPARFLLVAAMNPCPCGYWRTKIRDCKCSDGDVARYRARISGPLLDRIDLYVDVPSVDVAELRAREAIERSATVRERVIRARQRRAFGHPLPLTEEAENLLLQASRRMALSARAISRCVGVARTIAALAAADRTELSAVGEALQYRVPAEHGAEGAHPATAAVSGENGRRIGDGASRVSLRPL
jgi:magnesium chelatase family protein